MVGFWSGGGRPAAAIMIQGTGSGVGKSVLVAGLCRLFANRGVEVRPFKPQNMSNNAAVAGDGEEISRATALQALACRVAPSVDMNPILLKPQSDLVAQVVVSGRPWLSLGARDYHARKGQLRVKILSAFRRLQGKAELIVVEGSGSPAEINLRSEDLANMGFAEVAGVPVVLVGDIDRGGVMASLIGTGAILAPNDCSHVRGFLINKFRGDPALFEDGYREIAGRTGWPGLGIVPWLDAASRLPSEDTIEPSRSGPRDAIRIAVLMLPRISNSDDFDPLRAKPAVSLEMVPPGRPVPGDSQLVVIPGTKSTISDLGFLRAQGWDIDLEAHRRRGGRILGLCGGYQMLGRSIADPEGVEGEPGDEVAGLGYLAVDTVLRKGKLVRSVRGRPAAAPVPFTGYEIHSGQTLRQDHQAALLALSDGTMEGAETGAVAGCYVHGLFNDPSMRAYWLELLGGRSNRFAQHDVIDAALDAIANDLERALDVDAIAAIATSGH